MLNDVWAYDIKENIFRHLITTGVQPVPTYEHAAIFSGDSMLVFGGILPMTTNSSEGINFKDERERMLHANDILVLNLGSMAWSRLMVTGLESNYLKIHGHSAMAHPHKADQVFILGGKDTVDSFKSLLSNKTKNTWSSYEDGNEEMKVLVLNTVTGHMSALAAEGAEVEARYAHGSIPVAYSSRLTEDPMERQPDGAVVSILYGGLRTSLFGFCSPQVSSHSSVNGRTIWNHFIR